MSGRDDPGAINEIDHVFVHARRPERLFSLFTRVLGVPMSWPFTDYGPIVSGGVNLGEASLEFLRFPRAARLVRRVPRVGGLAFTVNSLDATIERLRGLGFATRRTPRASRAAGVEGLGEVTWVGAFVRGWPGVVAPFLCEYGHDPAERRPELLAALQRAGGGRLGIVGLRGIVVATRDASECKAWERLLGSVGTHEPRQWQFPTGAGRIEVDQQAPKPLTLLLAVESIDKVVPAAQSAGFQAVATEPEVRLQHHELPDMELRLASRG